MVICEIACNFVKFTKPLRLSELCDYRKLLDLCRYIRKLFLFEIMS